MLALSHIMHAAFWLGAATSTAGVIVAPPRVVEAFPLHAALLDIATIDPAARPHELKTRLLPRPLSTPDIASICMPSFFAFT